MGTSPFGGRRDRRSRTVGGPVRPIFDSQDSGQDKPDYKTAALCKQVRRIVALTLSGECGDTQLQSLVVNEVFPAPNAGRLLIQLIAPHVQGQSDIIDLLQRLEKVHGLLRSRIAQSIARKRTPELTFDILPGRLLPEEPHE